MKRREFLSAAGVVLATAAPAATPNVSAGPSDLPRAPLKMHLGTQQGPTTAAMLQYFKRHGCDHICGYPSKPESRGYWTLEELERTRDLCEKQGVRMEMVALPFLTSSHIDREKRGAIMLGESPARDRDIADIHKMIEACAKAGVGSFKYNMSLLGVLRTGSTAGRGGSTYSTWRMAEAHANPPLTRAGHVTQEQAWERIEYFLDRVIPVCNEHKVRAACHPHDPGVRPEGFQGVCRVLGTVDGLRKFVSIRESPWHGLNFCLGTIAEMLADPARELGPVVREFGEKEKIFNIHFRNIRGHRDDFREVYPDEGDVNLVDIARVLRDVGYEGMLMPDHVPSHPDDPHGLQAFAFAFGYIKAILQALS
ncbi:MAG TPA: mannonate dehydratase [Planctomycetaceae bacterium]|jgi:mannonate dehydratase|nr:mannonate dehydratase [Planctomycetaceae bacterium]